MQESDQPAARFSSPSLPDHSGVVTVSDSGSIVTHDQWASSTKAPMSGQGDGERWVRRSGRRPPRGRCRL